MDEQNLNSVIEEKARAAMAIGRKEKERKEILWWSIHNIRGGEINCPCCPSRTFVAPDKLSFPVDLSVDKWNNPDLMMSKEHHFISKSRS